MKILNYCLSFSILISSHLAFAVADIDAVVSAITSQTTIEIDQVYFGRVLRGKSPEDFKTMTHDLDRKIVFYMDSKGLEDIARLSNYEKLVQIGYPANYIDKKIKEGYQFKLVVFEGASVAMPATWDNVAKLVASVYGGNFELYRGAKNPGIVKLMYQHLGEIRKIYSGEGDQKASPSQAYQKIKALGGEIWEVRQFLHNNLNLNENFAGDGFTRLDSGQKGIAEYISPNIEIKSLAQFRILDLTL